jgi:tetratricopeptide (TPR) repeat protein
MDSHPGRNCRSRRRPRLLPHTLGACLGTLVLGSLAVVAPTGATSIEESVAAGDSAYVRGDFGGATAAYGAVLKARPGDYAALWRFARIESEHGEDATGENQKKLFTVAVEHARAAVKAAPDSALGHVWLAVALGRQALHEGPKTQLALAREIKSEIDRAIAIDPTIGRAWHVLALWNRKVASLNFMERMAANTVLGGVPKGASMENALRDLGKAIALEPAYVNHHLELGRTLVQLERWPEARKELETAIALPATSNPRDAKYQAEARALLAHVPAR